MRHALRQIGLGTILGLPLAGRLFLFFVYDEFLATTDVATTTVLVAGLGVMVLVGLLAESRPR